MTQQQTPRQIIAALSAFIDQQETARASAQALALQWQQVSDRQRAQIEALTRESATAAALIEQLKAERRVLCDNDPSTIVGHEAVRSLRQAQAVADGEVAQGHKEVWWLNGELTVLILAAQAVLDCIARDDNNVTPDTAAALRALERCVSSNKHAPAPAEEVQHGA